MFKNPLKYQQGGQTPTQEQQKLLAAFIEWLPKRVKEFQGMQPEQIAQALDGMSKTDEGKKQLQQLMMQFQQEMQGGSQAFRQGGKIHDFICKHAKGGKTGCGCKEDGGTVEKHQQDDKGRGKIGRLNSLNYVEREYDPEGNAIYTMAQTKEALPSVMRGDPFSDYSQNGGEYQGNGQVRIIDFGNGKTRILGNPYGPMNEDLWHGSDSLNALQHLRQLTPRAGIKLGPAIRKTGGKVEKHQQDRKGKGKIGDRNTYSDNYGTMQYHSNSPGPADYRQEIIDDFGNMASTRYHGFSNLPDDDQKDLYAGPDGEILPPGFYNKKGYPINTPMDTKSGVVIEVNPYGLVFKNGERQYGSDSLAVANLINQWNQAELGPRTDFVGNGLISKGYPPKMIRHEPGDGMAPEWRKEKSVKKRMVVK